MSNIDYEQAENYWIEHDKTTKHMSDKEIYDAADNFLAAHNTAALSTASGDCVRCTPIEYSWIDGCIYMLSEGGMKFHNLKDNKRVSLAIYEKYQGFGQLGSIQVTGQSQIMMYGCEEYKKVLDYKKIPEAAIQKLTHPMYLIKVVPDQFELLFSEFKKNGYDSRQKIKLPIKIY